MNAQHTPGPWFSCSGNAKNFYRIEARRGNDDMAIAELKGPDREANARLIAAAPELLAVCQALTGPNWPDIVALIMQAHAAVAKATQP